MIHNLHYWKENSFYVSPLSFSYLSSTKIRVDVHLIGHCDWHVHLIGASDWTIASDWLPALIFRCDCPNFHFQVGNWQMSLWFLHRLLYYFVDVITEFSRRSQLEQRSDTWRVLQRSLLADDSSKEVSLTKQLSPCLFVNAECLSSWSFPWNHSPRVKVSASVQERKVVDLDSRVKNK